MNCKKVQNSPENYRHKPKKCTDTLWICLLVTFWCFFIVIIVFAISYGNYAAALKGADSFGNICNQIKNKHFENFTVSAFDTSTKPYLFFFDNKNLESVVKICVEKCPTHNFRDVFHMFMYMDKSAYSQMCRYDYNLLRAAHVENYPPSIGRRGPCPPVSFQRNRCVPTGPIHIVRDMYELLNSGGVDQLFFLAVYSSWHYVAILIGFAFGISLLLFGMMVLLPMLIAWFIWLLSIGLNAGLCFFLWSLHDKKPVEENPDEFTFSLDTRYNTDLLFILLDEFRVNKILIFCFIGLTVLIDIVLIILTVILFRNLNQLKVFFELGRVCIKHLPGLSITLTIGLVTMISLIFLTGFTLLCLTTATYPTTIRITDYFEEDRDILYEFRTFEQIEYVDSKPIRRTFFIYILGFLWTTEFIFAFEEFCIGTSVAFWYFKSSSQAPSLRAIGVLLKYHLGTIAKGSAVITLLKGPRLIVTFICKSIKRRFNQIWFDRFAFVEECVGIYNHNAYIPAAFETIDFRQSAYIAFKISTKMPLKLKSISNTFSFVMFLSKLCVATLTCLLGVYLLKDKKDNLIFYMAPVLFSSICAFCIAHIVFSILEMTIDTLMLCACEDQMMYGGLKRLTKFTKLAKFFGNNGENNVPIIKIKTIYRQPFRARQ
ncbi:choline transporter-like 1 isoform X2 [Eupeodes corollae]|uniref:choline transporter-like 1 isoform X2 n=1 Tax=Eupeodes corollae TaxID=290404 RepID=UPI0024925D43|nr:choline transporter-like 1 isoform X2 [Eupeodes corollae]